MNLEVIETVDEQINEKEIRFVDGCGQRDGNRQRAVSLLATAATRTPVSGDLFSRVLLSTTSPRVRLPHNSIAANEME